MAAESDWTLRPRAGLGRLEFGMTPEQVDELADTYGASNGQVNDRIPDDLLRDTLEKFGDAMSDEEKQELIAMYAANGPAVDTVTEARGDPGLVLRYETGRLAEIMPAKTQGPLFLDGTDLRVLSAQDALALLERLNGGPGRYLSTGAAFDELAISVEGFCVTARDTGVRMLDDTDERFRGRTLSLRAQPYLPADEMDKFVTHRVLG